MCLTFVLAFSLLPGAGVAFSEEGIDAAVPEAENSFGDASSDTGASAKDFSHTVAGSGADAQSASDATQLYVTATDNPASDATTSGSIGSAEGSSYTTDSSDAGSAEASDGTALGDAAESTGSAAASIDNLTTASEGKAADASAADAVLAADVADVSSEADTDETSATKVALFNPKNGGAITTTVSNNNISSSAASSSNKPVRGTDGQWTIWESDEATTEAVASEIAIWTIEDFSGNNVTNISESGQYYVSCEIDGKTQYLTCKSTGGTGTVANAPYSPAFTTDKTPVYFLVSDTDYTGQMIISLNGNEPSGGETFNSSQNWYDPILGMNSFRTADSGAYVYRATASNADLNYFVIATVKTAEVNPGDYTNNLGTYFIGNYYDAKDGVLLNTTNSSGRLKCESSTITYQDDTYSIFVTDETSLAEKQAAYELWTFWGANSASGSAASAGASADSSTSRVSVTESVETSGSSSAVTTSDTADQTSITESGVYFVTTTKSGEEDTTYYLSITGSASDSVNLVTEPTPVYITVGTGSYTTGGTTNEHMLMFSNTVWDGSTWVAGDYCMKIDTISGANEVRGDGSGEANRWFVAGNVRTYSYETVAGTTPTGTIVNLFDYWTTTRWPSGGDYNETDIEDKGINEGRSLVFSNPATLTSTEKKGWNWNKATGDSNYINLVERTTGSDNYPKLNVETISAASSSNSQDQADGYSLAYLFNPRYASEYKLSWTNVTGLFQTDEQGYYYYNCTENFAEFDEDTNAFTLYAQHAVQDGQFFPFNKMYEAKNVTAATDAVMNHYFGLSLTDRFQMTNNGYLDSSGTSPMIFDFSGDDDVWIFIDGVLVADLGGVHNTTGVSIDFSTGKITYKYGSEEPTHDGTKNEDTTIYAQFDAAGATGTTTWQDVTSDGSETKIFQNETYHTLQFYYMERGNYASNMSIKYNLTSINPTSVTKVDQYGDPVSGAGLAAYKASYDESSETYLYHVDNPGGSTDTDTLDLGACESYRVNETTGVITAVKDGKTYTITPEYTGYSGTDGVMTFTNQYGGAYSTSELKSMFGERFIMREFSLPAGYRQVSDEIYFYFDNDTFLLCDNIYESGAMSNATALVTATLNLYYVSGVDDDNKYTGETVNYYNVSEGTHEGTLFAVVLKKNGSTDGVDTWFPVSGTAEAGYTVSDTSAENNIAHVIEIAKSYGTDHVFSMGDSKRMQLDLTELPGSITEYYTYQQMLEGDEYDRQACLAASEYFVAYYYTTENSLDGATAENTGRVVSRKQIITSPVEYKGFDIDFAADIHVTNKENQIYLYKFDVNEQYQEGGVFALYNVGEDESETLNNSDGATPAPAVYYLADQTDGGNAVKIYLDADTDGDNTGTAHIGAANGADATFTIDTKNVAVRDEGSGMVVGDGVGVITVTATDSTAEYTISPAVNAEGASQVAYTHLDCNLEYNSDGPMGHFRKVLIGSYIVREIAAPEHLLLNTTEVRTLVTSFATFVDAGTKDDNVSVAKGAGYLVDSLRRVASEGDINKTLSWIYTVIEKAPSSLSFADVSQTAPTVESESTWQYGVPGQPGEDVHNSTASNEITTENKSEAIVTYLEYDYAGTTAIFNYGITKDQKKNFGEATENTSGTRTTADGEGTRRLWAETGWVYMAVYQDTEYGSAQVKNTSVRYDILDGTTSHSDETSQDEIFHTTTYGEDGEISNLFSKNTSIVFFDQVTVDLEIDKVDAGGSGRLAGAEFYLYKTDEAIGTSNTSASSVTEPVEVSEEAEVGLGATEEADASVARYYYSYTDGVTSWIPAQGSDGTWVVPEGATLLSSGTDTYESIKVYNLPEGTYYLEEVTAPPGYLFLDGVVTITVTDLGVVSITYNGTVYPTSSGTDQDGGSDVSAASVASSADESSLWSVTDLGGYVWNITVPNIGGDRMPDTGAAGGLDVKILLPIIVAAAVGTAYIMRRKYRLGQKALVSAASGKAAKARNPVSSSAVRSSVGPVDSVPVTPVSSTLNTCAGTCGMLSSIKSGKAARRGAHRG